MQSLGNLVAHLSDLGLSAAAWGSLLHVKSLPVSFSSTDSPRKYKMAGEKEDKYAIHAASIEGRSRCYPSTVLTVN